MGVAPLAAVHHFRWMCIILALSAPAKERGALSITAKDGNSFQCKYNIQERLLPFEIGYILWFGDNNNIHTRKHRIAIRTVAIRDVGSICLQLNLILNYYHYHYWTASNIFRHQNISDDPFVLCQFVACK